VVSQETIDERARQFRQQIPLEGLLLACASCGVRDVFVNDDDVASGARDAARQHGSKSASDTSDLFALPEKPPAFVRLLLSDPLCDALRLTAEQVAERQASGYSEIFSAYDHVRDGVLTAVYHLHPQLIDNPTGDASFFVCQQCYKYLRKKKIIDTRASKRQPCSTTQMNDASLIRNTYAVCQGFDFGCLSSAPALSLLEKTLLARYVFYGVLIKLSCWNGIRQSAIKGHVIAFSHTALNQIEQAAHQLFPWFDNDDIVTCIKCSFVGPSRAAHRCLKVLCLEDGLLRANLRPLLWWLGLLKACHPGYKQIILPDQDQQPAVQSQMDNLQQEILSCTQIVSNKKSRNVDKKAGADIAGVRALPEDHDAVSSEEDIGSDDDDMHHMIDDINSDRSSDDDDSCSVDIDDPEFGQKLNLILSDSMIVDGNTASTGDPSPADVLGGLLNVLQHHPDNAEQPCPTIRAVRGNEPVNEIRNNDILMYFAFPCLFIFGRGLPENCTTIPHKLVRHLFLQYHCRFAQEPRFYFTVFNQMQRHAVSRAIVPRVKNSKAAILEFMACISEENIMTKLTSAIEDPTTEEAKLLTRRLLPLMTNLGATVPYSPSERRDMFSHFVSSMYRYL
jgi:hypothetical protein